MPRDEEFALIHIIESQQKACIWVIHSVYIAMRMHTSLLHILALTTLCAALPLTEFYPFGFAHGDNPVYSGPGNYRFLKLTSGIKFFDTTYEWICTNRYGVLSFERAVDYMPRSLFPFEGTPLLAGYWTSLGEGNWGEGRDTPYYRQTNDSSLLSRVSQEVNQVFPQQNFTATHMFIATWNAMKMQWSLSTRTCTFQIVLATDGHITYALFHYQLLECDTNVLAGFYSGVSYNFFNMPGARTVESGHLANRSNIDIPGKFLFRVDSTKVFHVSCNLSTLYQS